MMLLYAVHDRIHEYVDLLEVGIRSYALHLCFLRHFLETATQVIGQPSESAHEATKVNEDNLEVAHPLRKRDLSIMICVHLVQNLGQRTHYPT